MKKKPYYDLSQLEAGDRIFEDAQYGPCSGGARYGLFETVTKITKTRIFTDKGVYDKEGYNIKFPMYMIEWFEKLPFN